jgi:NAD(P)-dependent dehydrogenase (short-subunit alcohol dehydrogenase family)
VSARDLRGRRVLVTGAAGALGGAAAAALRARGARVVGLDLHGGDGVIACDVRDGDAVVRAVSSATASLGGIDQLVHFAGVGMPSSAGAAPDDAALRTLDINLVGAWRVTAACIDELVGSGGRVVFVASELALATLPFATAYTVSKRGLTAYADSLRTEYGTHIGVTTVYPGYIRTPIHDASVDAGLSLEGSTRAQRPEDVVSTVLRALTAARPPRDLACSLNGSFELAVARHLPRLVDAVIRRRLRRHLRSGRYLDAPLAAAMRGRHGFPGPAGLPIGLEDRAS